VVLCGRQQVKEDVWCDKLPLGIGSLIGEQLCLAPASVTCRHGLSGSIWCASAEFGPDAKHPGDLKSGQTLAKLKPLINRPRGPSLQAWEMRWHGVRH
jgi:hypothetical protein